MKPVKFANVTKRGCPSCTQVIGALYVPKNAKNCTTCNGKTWLFDWWDHQDGNGWQHQPGKVKR